MPRIIFIFAFVFLTTLLYAGYDASYKVAEGARLQDVLDKQDEEIARKVAYSIRLKQILGRAGLSVREPSLQQKLDWGQLHAHYDHARLADVLNTLARVAKIEIRVDWNSLADAGINPNYPITCELRNWSVYPALRTIIRGGNNANMGFYPENGVMKVTTAEQASKHVVTKVYDLKPLLSPNQSVEEACENFARLVTDTVAPDSWKDAGGTIGSLEFRGTRMFVIQTPENLVDLENLLEQLDTTKESEGDRATIDTQERHIAWLNAEIEKRVAQCRSAGIQVPPPVDQAMTIALPDIQFIGMPLSACFDTLRSASGHLVDVNWKVLQSAGVDPNTPIMLTLHRQTLIGGVQMLCDKVSDGKPPLQYVIENGMIRVSTREEFDKSTLTRAYDIRDLLPTHGSRQEAVEWLDRTLTNTIEPDSWRDAGGTVGSIRELQGWLVITHSERVHRIIKAWLDSLRRHQQLRRK